MEISNIITSDGQNKDPLSAPVAGADPSHAHQYPTRHSLNASAIGDGRLATPPMAGSLQSLRHSPLNTTVKNVSFELQLDDASTVRGRLPLRVQIFPHDTTESIVTTVKNFYGLYDSGNQTVGFVDVGGDAVTASYENLSNNMTVYVRVLPDLSQRSEATEAWQYRPVSPLHVNNFHGQTPMLPPQPAQILNYGQPPSRPGSRISRKQSLSPKLTQSKTSSSQKSRSRSGVKGATSSFENGLDDVSADAHNGYSSSDGGAGSVTSSRKARSELLATAEISVDNIVEGDRRQKAKFESSVSRAVENPWALTRSANSVKKRNYRSLYPHKSQRPIQSLRSRPSADKMRWIIPLH